MVNNRHLEITYEHDNKARWRCLHRHQKVS